MKPILTLLLIALIPSITHAGAWPQPPGATYAKLSVSHLSSNQFYTSEGHPLTTSNYSQFRLDAYAEVGITSRLTGVFRFPFLESSSFETSETNTAPGDLTLETRYTLKTGATPLALALRVTLPTGDSEGVTPLKGTEGFVRLPTGDNLTTILPVFTVSHSFYPVRAYATADAGYAFRTNGFTDEYRGYLEAGWEFASRFLLKGMIGTRGPVTTPNPDLALEARNGRGEGVQFTRVGGGLGYDPVDGFSVEVDVTTNIWRTVNAYGGTSFTLGVSWQRP